MQSDTQADYSAGYLLFARDTALMAQPFNSRTGLLEGTPAPIGDQVLVDPGTWRLAASGTEGGLLAYVSGGAAANQLTWYDRAGKATSLAGKLLNLNHVRLSPDGSKVAADLGESLSDIWLYDLRRGVSTRFTFGPSNSVAPVWSPDGRWIAYTLVERGHQNIYRKPASGTGQAELLLEGDDKHVQNWPTDWSPDGGTLLFYTIGNLVSSAQLWELPLNNNDRKPTPLLPSGFLMMEARFSPDGRWIAYASNESGRFEIYVIPASGTGGKWQISSSGGQQPLWRRDGKELFYLSSDDNLMSVPIKLRPDSVQADALIRCFR